MHGWKSRIGFIKAVYQWLLKMAHRLRSIGTHFSNVNNIQSMIPEDQKNKPEAAIYSRHTSPYHQFSKLAMWCSISKFIRYFETNSILPSFRATHDVTMAKKSPARTFTFIFPKRRSARVWNTDRGALTVAASDYVLQVGHTAAISDGYSHRFLIHWQ